MSLAIVTVEGEVIWLSGMGRIELLVDLLRWN